VLVDAPHSDQWANIPAPANVRRLAMATAWECSVLPEIGGTETLDRAMRACLRDHQWFIRD
jgi:hypothetical protein